MRILILCCVILAVGKNLLCAGEPSYTALPAYLDLDKLLQSERGLSACDDCFVNESQSGQSVERHQFNSFVATVLSDPLPDSSRTTASSVGVFYLPGDGPSYWTPRLGLGGTLGTHTQKADLTIGAAGIHTIGDLRVDYNLAWVGSLNGHQWSYDFAGAESQFSVEANFWCSETLAILNRRWSIGWRSDWFDNRSYRQLSGTSVMPMSDENHSPLSQHLGTIFVQWEHAKVEGFQRYRFEFQNDSLGGEGRDEFRTAQARILSLRQAGPAQFRWGIILDLFTGQVDKSRPVDKKPNGDTFRNVDGLAFSDRSQGLLEFQFGCSRFHQFGTHLGEIGANLGVGPDTEHLRDFFQNQLIHKRLLGVPQVPKVARSDRFKSDFRVYYTVHF